MNESRIMKDDPRLTAYALGELEGDARAEVEAAVCAHPELRAEVDAIRALAGQVEDAMSGEPVSMGAEPGASVVFPNAGAGRWLEPVEPRRADDVTAGTAPSWRIRVARLGGRGAERAKRRRPQVRGRYRNVVQFPAAYYVVAGLAAACFAIVVGLRWDEASARQRLREENLRLAWEKRAPVVRTEVTLLPNGAAEPAASTPNSEVRAVAAGRDERVVLAPADLSLLELAKTVTGYEDFGPWVLTAMPGDDGVMTSVGSQAVLAMAVTNEPPVDVAPSAPLPQIEFVPSIRDEGASLIAAASAEASEAGRAFLAPAAASSTRWGDAEMLDLGSEVVVLSAFRVSAQREGTFAMATAARRRSGFEGDGESRDYRPGAPAGARFGRVVSAEVRDNEFQRVAFQPVSTFAAEVGSASYGNVKRAVARGEWPAREVVRIEEMLNYFPYRYAGPAERRLSFLQKLGREDGAPPFAAALEVAEAPWAPNHRLVRIGLQGRELPMAERPAANLVFLVDVSSSMNEPNKLPLLKESLRALVGELRHDDRVAIVTYGGNGGVALSSTPVAREREIMAAIDALAASGIADGQTGIRNAYEIAQANFAEDGFNRVILCTDGDFSLGTTSEAEMMRLVEARAGTGVFLTVLGFGMRDYRDATLERLAELGNGTYGYIDFRREAQKLLVEGVSSTLVTIAKDVKIQVEFNPAQVASYRLIGYENRLLRREDFNTDEVDAGEIGAGHRVTALYEIVPVAGPLVAGRAAVGSLRGGADELLTVKVRYKKPGDFFGRTSEYPLADSGATFAKASADFRFAAAVAQLGMILRQSPHRGSATIGDVIAWAAAAAANPADDPGGYRGDFIDLARRVQEMLRE